MVAAVENTVYGSIHDITLQKCSLLHDIFERGGVAFCYTREPADPDTWMNKDGRRENSDWDDSEGMGEKHHSLPSLLVDITNQPLCMHAMRGLDSRGGWCPSSSSHSHRENEREGERG